MKDILRSNLEKGPPSPLALGTKSPALQGVVMVQGFWVAIAVQR